MGSSPIKYKMSHHTLLTLPYGQAISYLFKVCPTTCHLAAAGGMCKEVSSSDESKRIGNGGASSSSQSHEKNCYSLVSC